MADLERVLRDCLGSHADDADVAPDLAAGVRARSRQLARRARATVALALVPAAAGVTVGSVALADAGSSSGPVAGTHTITVDAASPSASPQSGGGSIRFAHCPRGSWVSLQRLSRDTQLAVKPIGLPTLIRRYTNQHPNSLAGFSTTRKAVVDGHRISAWSYAVEIVTNEHRHIWKLMIGTPPHSDHYYHRSTVYNAARHGCIAVREGTS